MESRDLRNFARVARCGSFSRAAEELGVVQSALSRQILKLERELGVELFARHGRGVYLTSAGSLLLDRAEEISLLIHRTRDEVKLAPQDSAGSIAIGVPPAAGLLVVSRLVQSLRAELPHLNIYVRDGVSTLLQEWLVNQQIDIALVHNPPLLQALKIRPVLTERMVVVGPPRPHGGGHDARKSSYRIRDIAELPLVMPRLPHNIRRLVEQAAIQHGVRLSVKAEVDSIALTKTLVRDGLGFSVLTHASVQDEEEAGELRIYPIERPALTSTLSIVVMRGKQQPPLIQRAGAVLRATLRDLVQDRQWADGKLIA